MAEQLVILLVEDNVALGHALRQRWHGTCILEPQPFEDGKGECRNVDDYFARALAPALKRHADDRGLVLVVNLNLKVCGRSLRFDEDGVELVKHVRLTPSLGGGRTCHAVLYTFERTADLLLRRPGNLVICSTGVTLVRLPEESRLLDRETLSQLASARADIRPEHFGQYVRCELGDNDERQYLHVFLNRAGPGKLLREFAGDVAPEDHWLYGVQARATENDSYWKKLVFLRPALRPEEPPSADETVAVRQLARGKRFVQIDDEHNRGWSLALYAGLTGQVPDETEYRHWSSLEPAEFPNGFLTAFCSEAATNKFIAGLQSQLAAAVGAWSVENDRFAAQDEKRKHSDEALRKAQVAHRSAKSEFQKREEQFRASSVISQQRCDDLKALLETFASAAWNLVDARSGGKSEDEQISGLRSAQVTLRQMTSALDSYDFALRDLHSNHNAVDRSGAELAEASRIESAASDAARIASQNSRLEADALAAARRAVYACLPYSLVFLDLRLNPLLDERRSPDELGAATLLRTMKQAFPFLPVVVMTASQRAVNSEFVRSLGADAYWIKGISTGDQLRRIISECLHKFIVRELWLKCQLIFARTTLPARRWVNGEFVLSQIATGSPQRTTLEELLRDSLVTLYSHAAPTNSPGGPFNHIIRNLGVIQEIRIQQVNDKLWRLTGAEDQALHELRNVLSHAGQTRAATRQDAMRFLTHSLDRLLDP